MNLLKEMYGKAETLNLVLPLFRNTIILERCANNCINPIVKEFRMCWEIYLKSQKFSSFVFVFFVLFAGALRQEVGIQHLTEPHLNCHAFVCLMRLIWQDQETKVTPSENVSKFCRRAPACESGTTTLTVFHYAQEIEVKIQAKE